MLRGEAPVSVQAGTSAYLQNGRYTSVLDTIVLTQSKCSDVFLGASKTLHRVQCSEFRAMTPKPDIRGCLARSPPKDRRGRAAAGQHSVIRRFRNHPHRNRLPGAIARLALIRDEVGVIAVLNFVPIGFDMSCH